MAASQILKFYENTNVFITGATGFLGKILMEKLLRSTSVSTLYILIRSKKNKDAHTRMKDLFEDAIFDNLHRECPKFIHRIVVISGDTSLTNLGISEADRQILIDKIDIVFHGAATVRFDENLKLAFGVNVKGTKYLLNLAREMKQLKSLIHVSTAYSNCYQQEIEEKIYDCHTNYESMNIILEKMTESQADNNTNRIIGRWPNTYTFTKALTEGLIKEECGNLPVAIFRPSIVISTYKEPTPGWIDNWYGPTGVCAAVSSGILRVMHCNPHKRADMVPVDMCVAALIASAWDTGEKYEKHKLLDNIPVFNYVSGENSLTWSEFRTLNTMWGEKFPCNRCIWSYNLNFTENIYLIMLMRLFFHILPALFFDFIGMLFSKRVRLLSMYRRIHKFSDVLAFFCTREWNFSNDNVLKLWNKLDQTEQKLFYFDIASLDWWAYYRHYLCGIRKYILKESNETLAAAIRKKKMLDSIHGVFLNIIYFSLSILAWSFLKNLFYSSSTPC